MRFCEQDRGRRITRVARWVLRNKEIARREESEENATDMATAKPTTTAGNSFRQYALLMNPVEINY